MRFAVESWSPDYGAPTTDQTLVESPAEVDAWVEAAPEQWSPRRPSSGAGPLDSILFVDGVRRVEAHVWITTDDGQVHQGLCASFASGGVLCNGAAVVVGPQVRRGLFSSTPHAEPIVTSHARFDLHSDVRSESSDLTLLVQDAMARLEVDVARLSHDEASLVVVDGPLRQGHNTGQPSSDIALVGYIKTHTTSYGPPVVRETVTRLGPGERTPIMALGGRHPKFSWYLRLPCDVAHGWSGVVRLETLARHPATEVVSFADRLALTLGRYASAPQKDPRAPQNLYPIGGLERELRRRLGDAGLVYRSLRVASAVEKINAGGHSRSLDLGSRRPP